MVQAPPTLPVTVRLSTDAIERLKRMAKDMNIKHTEFIRKVLYDFVEGKKK